jgi:hypothetical protein
MSTYASQAPLSSPNMRTVNVQIRSPSAAVRSPKSPVRRQSTLQLRVVPLRADANIFDQHGQLKEKADMEHPDEDEVFMF